MQNVLSRNGFLADAAFGERQIFSDRRVEMMADHQHVEMLIERVDGEGARGIGAGGQHVWQAADFYNIGRMPAARAFSMEGVNRAALERGDRVFHEAGFVQRVGVDHHLNVVNVGHAQAIVDSGGRCAPILMQLQGAGARDDLFFKRGGQSRIALACKTEIHRERVSCFNHARDVPRAGRAGGGERAVRRAGAAAQHRGYA